MSNDQEVIIGKRGVAKVNLREVVAILKITIMNKEDINYARTRRLRLTVREEQ